MSRTVVPDRVYRIDAGGTVKRTLTVNTDLLLLALAEEHSPIGAILRAARADRRLMLTSGFRKYEWLPQASAEEDVGFVATSTWRVRL